MVQAQRKTNLHLPSNRSGHWNGRIRFANLFEIQLIKSALTIFGESGTAMELTWSDALGDGIAFLGAIFAASYISVGSSTRSQFPGTFTFVFSMWVVSLVVFLAGTLLFERPELSSLFNWYVDGIWPIVLWLALVTGLIGKTKFRDLI